MFTVCWLGSSWTSWPMLMSFSVWNLVSAGCGLYHSTYDDGFELIWCVWFSFWSELLWFMFDIPAWIGVMPHVIQWLISGLSWFLDQCLTSGLSWFGCCAVWTGLVTAPGLSWFGSCLISWPKLDWFMSFHVSVWSHLVCSCCSASGLKSSSWWSAFGICSTGGLELL